MHLADVVIEAIDVRGQSDGEIAETHSFWTAIRAESHPEDPPTPLDVEIARIRNLPSFVEICEFAARVNGNIVGMGEAVWTTTDDNPHLIQAGVWVLPACRRRGIGRELLRKLVEVAEREGRTTLLALIGASGRVPAGTAFAQAVGAEAALAEHTNRLLLADVNRDMIKHWIKDGPKRAPGYRLIMVDGPHPDDLIEQIVDLMDVMNTAPRGDIDTADWHMTVEHMRDREKQMVAEGTERWWVGARYDTTGELVGFTELFYNAKKQPHTIDQGGTGVSPEHRGHALGKWLKAVNIDRVLRERPEVVDIRTGNADSNDAMLGINEALGFKPYYANTAWQITVDQVRKYLDGY